MAAAVPYVWASDAGSQHTSNIIFVAASEDLEDIWFQPAPAGGLVLRDDLNPIEVLLERARAGRSYGHR
jgi:hypothetical protein